MRSAQTPSNARRLRFSGKPPSRSVIPLTARRRQQSYGSGVDPGLWPDGGALDRQTAAAPSKVQFEIDDLWRVLGVGFGPHAD